jgi:hypothetical protein
MFIDIALQPEQKPIRIALYEDSEPERIAQKFIKQQGIDHHTYYMELVSMMKQAKDNALIDRKAPSH